MREKNKGREGNSGREGEGERERGKLSERYMERHRES